MDWTDKTGLAVLTTIMELVQQGKITNPEKNLRADTGQYAYDYADLDEVSSCYKPALLEAGILTIQGCVEVDGQTMMRTAFLDPTTGGCFTSDVPMPEGITNPQRMGAAITYMRRYGIVTALNMVVGDDDASMAGTVITTKATQELVPDQGPTANYLAGVADEREMVVEALLVIDAHPDPVVEADTRIGRLLREVNAERVEDVVGRENQIFFFRNLRAMREELETEADRVATARGEG